MHDEQAIVNALEAGAEDYCVKPLRPAEFLARIAALQRRKAHRSYSSRTICP
jgi:two-component system KDP operon response regulator KdpE